MTLWLAAVAVIALHLAHRGPVPLIRALAPLAAFIGWGALAVLLWSVDPVTGARTLVFWSLAAGVAAAAGDAVPAARLARAVALLVGAIVAASLLLAAFVPEAAHTLYGAELMVRGLFPHKNQLGWFAVVGLLWTWALRGPIGPGLIRLLIPILAAGVVVSGSGTALVVAIAAGTYLLGLRVVRTLLPDGGRAALALAAATLLVTLAVVTVAPGLLDALGRDPTLTGRTGVWQHYLETVEARTLSGYGTGVFSTPSTLNIAVGGTVPGHERESLHSPHSLYIGIVGETGLVGLAAFVIAMLHLAFVAPFGVISRWRDAAGALAFAILVAGIAETRDGYAPGVATVLLLTARGADRAQERAIRRSVIPSRAYS